MVCSLNCCETCIGNCRGTQNTLMERHGCRSLEDSMLSAIVRFGEHALGTTKAACSG